MLSSDSVQTILQLKTEQDIKLRAENPILDLIYTVSLDEKMIEETVKQHLKTDEEIKAFADSLTKKEVSLPNTKEVFLPNKLDFSDKILSSEDIKELAEFIKNNRTVYYLILPEVLIYDPLQIILLKEAILQNGALLEVTGLYDEDNKISDHVTKNPENQKNNREKIKQTMFKLLHQKMIARIKNNDPSMVRVDVIYEKAKTDRFVQLELFSALSKNTYVITVNFHLDFSVDENFSKLIYHSLKKNTTLEDVDLATKSDELIALFKKNQNEKTMKILRDERSKEKSEIRLFSPESKDFEECLELIPKKQTIQSLTYKVRAHIRDHYLFNEEKIKLKKLIQAISKNTSIEEFSFRNIWNQPLGLFEFLKQPSSSENQESLENIIKEAHKFRKLLEGTVTTNKDSRIIFESLLNIEEALINHLPKDVIRNIIAQYALSAGYDDLNPAPKIETFSDICKMSFDKAMFLFSKHKKDASCYNSFKKREAEPGTLDKDSEQDETEHHESPAL